MKIFTIGFTQKTAKDFFSKIKNNNIELLLDIRLNNTSQLAGFAKGKDLEYFLKEICSCEYVHDIAFSPTKELLDNYRAKKIIWNEYENIFSEIMDKRHLSEIFKKLYMSKQNVCLLCTEPTPEQCHRRLVAEYLNKHIGNIEIIHI
ncbi:MAG: DUF488 domain-containing protein [Bacilli bacterium]|nr:DUF488 domain-containing protein [bacterium]MDY2697692.1 DUF488 domain-containing protein [Bacilli bacterium]